MAVELKVPEAGESIVEVQIGDWLKEEGEVVEVDEAIVVLETDKASMELSAPASGKLDKIVKPTGETVKVGDIIGLIEEGEATEAARPAKSETTPQTAGEAPGEVEAPVVMPAAKRLLAEHDLPEGDVTGTGPGGRILKEDVLRHIEALEAQEEPAPSGPEGAGEEDAEAGHLEEVVPMSLLRRRVAANLVEAQQTAALLTTFNEIDMSNVVSLRKEHQDVFVEKHGIKLGFMSFFVKACVDALKQFPALNAEIRDDSIVYRNYYDIGIAVGGGKGLVVPVLRSAERLSFSDIEKGIKDFAARAKANRLQVEELQGGTFTITNGGVYGSLLSTPIINPPQSGILGMHAIQERPVAREGEVVIRPMMYVALTYDHRIVDGREAVLFLRRIKECVESPSRILIEA